MISEIDIQDYNDCNNYNNCTAAASYAPKNEYASNSTAMKYKDVQYFPHFHSFDYFSVIKSICAMFSKSDQSCQHQTQEKEQNN